MIKSDFIQSCKAISRLTVLFVLWAVCPVYTQIVTNKGAILTGTNGSIVWVNGSYCSVSNGQSSFEGNSLLQVNGNMVLQSGAVNLRDSSLGVVTDSCILY